MSLRKMFIFTLGAKIKNLIQAFKDRVLGNQGQFEGESCLDTQLVELNDVNILDSASLIITLNGYKEQVLYTVQPNDGTADLEVVRATTGTRVNADGLIEEVPYNMIIYSEEFEINTWTKINYVVIENTALSPIGTLTADTLRIPAQASAGRKRLYQDFNQSRITVGATYTFSIYAKKNQHRWMQLNFVVGFSLNDWANFDLEDGVIGNTGTGAIATIEDVGDGWYRLSITGTAVNTVNYTAEVIATNNTDSGRYPNYQALETEDAWYIWGAQLVTGTQPKDYYRTTTRLNIPRIDYSNGSCPSILVEPQRTNLVIQSENLIVSPWIYQNGNGVSTNDLNPAGQNSSNRINLLLSGFSSVRQVIPSLNNTTYTISCFFKKIPGFDNSFQMRYTNELIVPNNFNAIAFINPNTKTATFSLSGTDGTGISGSIIGKVDLYPNDWFRVSMRFTSGSSSANVNALFRPVILVNSTASVLTWGAQLEVGANATSYIPTVASTVTRNADVIRRTDAQDLIGQTEGTIFLDFYYGSSAIDNLIFIQNSLTNYLFRARIGLTGDNNFNVAYFNSSAGMTEAGVFTDSVALIPNARNKIVVTYNGVTQRTRLFLNGLFISETLVTTAFPTNQNIIDIGITFFQTIKEINNVSLWKTQITDAQAIQLTTL